MPGTFQLPINGRSQSMSTGMGLGPGLGKSRRVRPGISRLWESLASPAKGPSTLPPPFQETDTTPFQRAKSTSIPGFSVVRHKTSPMTGVGRKLKEKRRVKQPTRGNLEVDADVDYGTLDPLDGEEGELVGCTCTGWGDGECVCGYGYWDVYDYGCEQTQEPESTGNGASMPGPLTRLPPELFLHVLSYLPLHSVLAVASTCRSWRALALDNSVWWRLWQAREGVPRLPSHWSSGFGHQTHGSCGTFGRRYRGVKDEGIHGLSMHTPELEHDGEQWDESRGWSVDFDRAIMRLKDHHMKSWSFLHPNLRHAGDERGRVNDLGLHEAWMPPSSPLISRQAPLMLDWRKLYQGRSILEQRWRDPEGEPRVVRIEGHKDR
ncbi:hypothetical protein F5I97DRAFT_158313 [Phlebopus sp. FC_14]|nr:hypothetical protein F5I97DRAFT_158313 [Phlebopus sp. FC_14]